MLRTEDEGFLQDPCERRRRYHRRKPLARESELGHDRDSRDARTAAAAALASCWLDGNAERTRRGSVPRRSSAHLSGSLFRLNERCCQALAAGDRRGPSVEQSARRTKRGESSYAAGSSSHLIKPKEFCQHWLIYRLHLLYWLDYRTFRTFRKGRPSVQRPVKRKKILEKDSL
jgi:hypothetical protein